MFLKIKIFPNTYTFQIEQSDIFSLLNIAVYVQPIISKARADLLKSHFLPTLEKLKKKTVKVVSEEELLKADSKGDTQEAELLILDEFAVLCRDLYAFYPMLIRYVDNNRLAHWVELFKGYLWGKGAGVSEGALTSFTAGPGGWKNQTPIPTSSSEWWLRYLSSGASHM